MTSEKELMRAKEDAIIENAEIISYKMFIQLAEKLNVRDAILILKQNLQRKKVWQPGLWLTYLQCLIAYGLISSLHLAIG